jgi:hypothetical protein
MKRPVYIRRRGLMATFVIKTKAKCLHVPHMMVTHVISKEIDLRTPNVISVCSVTKFVTNL